MRIFGWFVGVFIVLASLPLFMLSIGWTLLALLGGVICLPPIWAKINKKQLETKKSAVRPSAFIFLGLVLFFTGTGFSAYYIPSNEETAKDTSEQSQPNVENAKNTSELPQSNVETAKVTSEQPLSDAEAEKLRSKLAIKTAVLWEKLQGMRQDPIFHKYGYSQNIGGDWLATQKSLVEKWDNATKSLTLLEKTKYDSGITVAYMRMLGLDWVRNFGKTPANSVDMQMMIEDSISRRGIVKVE